MARYRKIDPRIHNDAKYKALSERGKLLFLTILTHPHMTALGAMRATEAGLCQEMTMGASKKDADCPADCPVDRGEKVFKSYQSAFRSLIKIGLIKFDPANSCLVIPNFLKYNQPESPSVVKGWSGANDLIPECQLKDDLIRNTREFLKKHRNSSFLEAFELALNGGQADGQAAPQPVGQGAGQQEQEQEQEKNTPPNPPTGGDEISDFERWWQAYPPRRKTAKPQCLRKWKMLNKSGDLLPIDMMLKVLSAQKRGPDWVKDDGEYIPGPHRYLNELRFKQEIRAAVLDGKPHSYVAPPPQITPENAHEYADPGCKECEGKGFVMKPGEGNRPAMRPRCSCTEKNFKQKEIEYEHGRNR